MGVFAPAKTKERPQRPAPARIPLTADVATLECLDAIEESHNLPSDMGPMVAPRALLCQHPETQDEPSFNNCTQQNRQLPGNIAQVIDLR